MNGGYMPSLGLAYYRHARHYSTVLCKLDYLCSQGHQKVLDAFSQFSHERKQIEDAIQWLLDRKIMADYDHILVDYAIYMENIGGLRYADQERIPLLSAALDAAQRCGRYPDEGRLLGDLGHMYRLGGDVQRAMELYNMRLELAHVHQNTRELSHAYGNMGIGHLHSGDKQSAVSFFRKRLETARQINDRRGEGIALSHLAVADDEMSDKTRIEHFREHIKIAQAIGDYRGEGDALGKLGHQYIKMGDWPRAIHYLERQTTLVEKLEDKWSHAYSLALTGMCRLLVGEIGAAIFLSENALKIKLMDDLRTTSIASWTLCIAFEQLGQLDTAVRYGRATIGIEENSMHPDAESHRTYFRDLLRRLSSMTIEGSCTDEIALPEDGY